MTHAFGYLLVFVGGAIGSMLRHGVNHLSGSWLGMNFSWGTLIVNVAGSLLMGVLAGYYTDRPGTHDMRLFLATGVLGGFTTFSAFSLDTALLWERGQTLAAVLYVTASVLLSVLALFAGIALARSSLA